jgi:hypothetical protein
MILLNTLAFYDMTRATVVESFIVQAPSVKVSKHFMVVTFALS